MRGGFHGYTDVSIGAEVGHPELLPPLDPDDDELVDPPHDELPPLDDVDEDDVLDVDASAAGATFPEQPVARPTRFAPIAAATIPTTSARLMRARSQCACRPRFVECRAPSFAARPDRHVAIA
jgi:hypothetical protein